MPNRGFLFNGAGLPKLDAISYVENAYQLSDTAGEFYLDSAAGFVYYIPRSGENLSTADVELPTQQTLLNVSGTPGHLTPVNDTDPGITYTGSAWGHSSSRSLGDLYDDVHYTTANGDSASYTFTGTRIDVLSETNSDEGGIDVYVDGTKAQTQSVSATSSSRLAQQVVASVSGLTKGRHTVKLVKTSGTYMLVDGFTVLPDAIAPAHDLTFQDLTFAYTTWLLPSTAGYIDNQAGVLWDASSSHAPIRIPAAVQVHRGSNTTFTGDEIAHTGGAGIDLADGTQNSTITGSYIHDTSSATRQAQVVIYSNSALSVGSHTIQFVKRSGTWATLDGFEVTGVYDDTAPSISFTGGSWQYYADRGVGDYENDVHAATMNGDSVTVIFTETGTGISLITETNSDEGTIGVSLDGASQGAVNAFAPSRFAQQAVYAVGGLPIGRHSLTLTKTGGAYLVIDRFDVK